MPDGREFAERDLGSGEESERGEEGEYGADEGVNGDEGLGVDGTEGRVCHWRLLLDENANLGKFKGQYLPKAILY